MNWDQLATIVLAVGAALAFLVQRERWLRETTINFQIVSSKMKITAEAKDDSNQRSAKSLSIALCIENPSIADPMLLDTPYGWLEVVDENLKLTFAESPIRETHIRWKLPPGERKELQVTFVLSVDRLQTLVRRDRMLINLYVRHRRPAGLFEYVLRPWAGGYRPQFPFVQLDIPIDAWTDNSESWLKIPVIVVHKERTLGNDGQDQIDSRVVYLINNGPKKSLWKLLWRW